MKDQIRILGIDDSPFRFGGGKALVVGAVMRAPSYLEGLMRTEVTIDGRDSTEKLVEMVSRSRYCEQVKVVMLDGIALAGFNIVDIEALHSSLGVPVLTVTRDEPDLEGIRGALKKYFDDWEERYRLISRFKLRRVETEHKPLFACGTGLEWGDFERIIKLSTVRGVVPEPIRVAHLVAAAMVKGESRGRS